MENTKKVIKEIVVLATKSYANVFEKKEPVLQENTKSIINTLEVVKSDFFNSFEMSYLTGKLVLGGEITFFNDDRELWYTGKIVYLLEE